MKSIVVGYGSIGKRHVRNLLSIPDMEVIVYTKQKIDNQLPKKVKIINSIIKCLHEKPDIGIIANVTSLHVDAAIKLATAGIDLLVEKPLSHSTKNVNKLLNLIKRKKLITLVGCQLRFHKSFKKIKEFISQNKIGRIISVRVECGSYLPEWHPYEDYRNSYASRNDLGGGVVLTCIHEIDYLYWFFGDVDEVFSITGKFSDLKIRADDLSVIIMRFKNNVIAEVHLDYFQKPSFRSCKIIGTKGTIYWDSEINTVKLYDNNKEKWVEKIKLVNYERNTMYVKELEHFLECVKKRKNTINPIQRDGVKTLQIALSIIESAKIKKIVKL